MSTSFELSAELRDTSGTNESRRMRREGKVPAIVYGAGKESRKIFVDHEEVYHNLEVEAFHSAIISLRTSEVQQDVILRDVQMHPFKPRVLHVDFQRVKATEKLHMNVPLHFEGAESAPGVKIDAGIMSYLMTELDVTCLPRDLPEYIVVDVSELGLNESIHLSEVTLPEGVELTTALDPEGEDPGVVNITPAKIHEEEVETEEEEFGVEEGEVAEAPEEESEPE